MSDADEIYARWLAKRQPRRNVRVVIEKNTKPPDPKPAPVRPRTKPVPADDCACDKNHAASIRGMTTF